MSPISDREVVQLILPAAGNAQFNMSGDNQLIILVNSKTHRIFSDLVEIMMHAVMFLLEYFFTNFVQ